MITFIKTKLSWIFKSFSNATASAANERWNFSFSRNAKGSSLALVNDFCHQAGGSFPDHLWKRYLRIAVASAVTLVFQNDLKIKLWMNQIKVSSLLTKIVIKENIRNLQQKTWLQPWTVVDSFTPAFKAFPPAFKAFATASKGFTSDQSFCTFFQSFFTCFQSFYICFKSLCTCFQSFSNCFQWFFTCFQSVCTCFKSLCTCFQSFSNCFQSFLTCFQSFYTCFQSLCTFFQSFCTWFQSFWLG